MDILMPFFDWLLAASARASLLTVAVFLTQAILRHRVPARWNYSLWLPVLVVLLMPVFLESTWSVTSITQIAPAPLPESSVARPMAALPVSISLTEVPENHVSMSWRQILCLVWLVGAIGMLLSGIVAYAHTLWRFRHSRLPVGDALQRELAHLAGEIGLHPIPRVWIASAIRSPAVTGLLRPRLLLPADFEKTLLPHEARLVLKHELMHIKRGDLLINALLCLVLAIHWFNPLLWVAFFKARLDREAACDAQVLNSADQTLRVAYGHTLLKVESAFNPHGLSLGFVGLFQKGAALRARIHSIANPPSSPPMKKTAMSLGIVFLTVIGITKAATPDPKAPQIYIVSKFIELNSFGGDSVPKLPEPFQEGMMRPGIVGLFPDPQIQKLIRELSQQKGVDLLAAPSVTTRSGRKAQVEVVREFLSPDGTSPQKPTDPSVGVYLTVIPNVGTDSQITLDVSSKIVEFDGFEDPLDAGDEPVISRSVIHVDETRTESASDLEKGELRETKFDAQGELLSTKTVPLSKEREKKRGEPLFSIRQVKAQVIMATGQSVLMEMEPRTDTQTVEEADAAGNILSSKIELHHRRAFVLVTAYLMDSATGKPQGPPSAGGTDKK